MQLAVSVSKNVVLKNFSQNLMESTYDTVFFSKVVGFEKESIQVTSRKFDTFFQNSFSKNTCEMLLLELQKILKDYLNMKSPKL